MAFKHKKSNEVLFRSGYEDKVVVELIDRGVEFYYEQLQLEYCKPAKKHKYTPDLELTNGILVELKGYMDRDTRQKMLYVIASNPDRDIRIVFESPTNKILKGSKTTYGMWADKNNIKWGTVDDIVSWSKE